MSLEACSFLGLDWGLHILDEGEVVVNWEELRESCGWNVLYERNINKKKKYNTIKLKSATKWIKLETIMLCEVTQTQKDMCSMLSHLLMLVVNPQIFLFQVEYQ